MSEKLLIVEDDKKLNDGIRLALKNDAYFFYQCRTLQEAREILKKEDITLVLLDVNLPDGNGIDFVREIRKNSQVPIILLTVNNMEVDIVTGLEAGANDYITKPFSPKILVARVEAVLRRTNQAEETELLEYGGIVVDKTAHSVTIDGKPIDLSFKEFELLTYFMENKGIALSREKILNHVWNYDYFGDARTIDTHVKKLRSKLGDKGDLIKTIWGVGYKMGE